MTDGLDIAELRREMIGDYLSSMDLEYFRDHDGDFFLTVHADDRVDEIRIGSDPTGAVVWVDVISSVRFPVEKGPLLVLLTNEYMKDHRWPRLTVVLSATGAAIRADGHLYVSESVGQDEIVRFLDVTLTSTAQFWDEFKAPDAGRLDQELRTMLGQFEDGQP